MLYYQINSLSSANIKIQKPIVKNLKQFDVIVLLAWNFKDEILQFLKKIKFKGEVIVPLPKIKIIKLNK